MFSNYAFEPSSQTVTIASNNVDNIDFLAATGLSVSGHIQIDSCDNATCGINVDIYPVQAGIVNFSSQPLSTVQPNSDGSFVFIGIASGTYAVKPRLEGYGFDPNYHIITLNDQDVTDLYFAAVSGLYISGKATNVLGIGFDEVEITLAGDQSTTALTSADGVYTFTGLSAGDYTVSISSDGYNALPSKQAVELVSESKDDVDFVLYPICPIVYVNIPFYGGSGSLVNIFGINFGLEPPDDLLVSVGEVGISIPAGVYFGTSDPATWVRAKTNYWSPVKILAEAPDGIGIVNIWVINETGCYYTNPVPTNFFILGL